MSRRPPRSNRTDPPFPYPTLFRSDDTDTVDLLVNATVLDECSIENPTDVTFATVNINEGAGANALLLKNGNQHDTQNIYVSCNYAAKLTATSANGGLLNAPGAALAANDRTEERRVGQECGSTSRSRGSP